MPKDRITKAEASALIQLGASGGGYLNSADGTAYYAGGAAYRKRPSKGLAGAFRKLKERGLVWFSRLDDGVTWGVYLEDKGKELCRSLTPPEADETAERLD